MGYLSFTWFILIWNIRQVSPQTISCTGWIQNGGQEFYIDSQYLVNQTTAEQVCQECNGHLATIDSKLQNDWLLQRGENTSQYWIGLVRSTSASGWIWLDGSSYLPTQQNLWANEEPSNLPEETCVRMNFLGKGSGLWGDTECTRIFRFICSRSNLTIVSTSSTVPATTSTTTTTTQTTTITITTPTTTPTTTTQITTSQMTTPTTTQTTTPITTKQTTTIQPTSATKPATTTTQSSSISTSGSSSSAPSSTVKTTDASTQSSTISTSETTARTTGGPIVDETFAPAVQASDPRQTRRVAIAAVFGAVAIIIVVASVAVFIATKNDRSVTI